jgi:hypothetical protein
VPDKRSFWRAFRTTERWEDRRSMLVSVFWYAPKYRLRNRLLDIRAVLAGACNASTWTGNDYAGGYSHWRCGKRRGHLARTLVRGHEDGSSGLHRFNNYTWTGNPADRTEYQPLPLDADYDEVLPFHKQTKSRHPIDTRYRTRVRARRAEAALAARQSRRVP